VKGEGPESVRFLRDHEGIVFARAEAPAAATDVLSALFLFALLEIFVLGALLFVLGFYSAKTLVFVYSLEIILIAAISVAVNRLRGWRFDLFEPSTIVNVMFLLYYSVRPIYLMTLVDSTNSSSFVSNNPAMPIDYAWAVGYAEAGLLCFHIGYYTTKCHLPKAFRLQARRFWASRRATRVVVVGGAWAIASTVVGVFAAGGIGATLANVGRLRELTAGWGYATLGTSFFVIGAVVLLVDHLLGTPRIFWIVVFSAFGIGYSAFVGNRTGMFALIMSFIVVYAYVRGIKSYVRFALWLIVVGIILVPTVLFWGVARELNTGVSDIAHTATLMLTKEPRFLYAATLNEFSAVDSFAAVLHGGPTVFPFRYGKTYLDGVLFLVPRAIWPDKPKAFSTAVGDYVTEDGNDVPPGVVGELYANFHVFGIVAGMFLLGRFMAFIHQRVVRGNFGAIAMYALLLPYFGVFLSRNFVGGGILLLTMLLLMWPAVRYIEGLKKRMMLATLRSESPIHG
jgi:oligosaccharide repeat unit polymerase